jgi:Protein of unknown function (DUF1524)
VQSLAVPAPPAATQSSLRAEPAPPQSLSPPPGAPLPTAKRDPAVRVGQLLTTVRVVDQLPEIPGYERSCTPGKGCVFGPAWKDIAHTGCDTRNRVLAAQLTAVEFKPGTRQCKVVAGLLKDPYTGRNMPFGTPTAREIEIDHVFALSRAWDAGAAWWPPQRREEFANDTDNLLAVSAAQNGSKSDSGPGTWLPPDRSFRCPLVEIYLRVAAKYQLAVTDDDRDAAIAVCAA